MLKNLKLINFRSHRESNFGFDQVTIFVGANGVGKTNIVEAVSYLALGRSFRARADREVMSWDESVTRVVGEFDEAKIEIILTTEPKVSKVVKINEVNRRAIELLGAVNVVLFLPDSLDLVAGSPQLRRQFFDLVLVQSDRTYAYHLIQLQKILRQRNRLLRQVDEGQAEQDQLDFWDEALASHGSYITAKRVNFLRSISTTIVPYYHALSNKNETLRLEYRAASVSQSSGQVHRDLSDYSIDQDDWQRLILESIKKYRHREIVAGASLYGPQRDDFMFILADRPLVAFGSRGEFRSAVLALKASEADYLDSEKSETSLIFLLDDVYSELDLARRQQLRTIIGARQSIITTTDLNHLGSDFQKNGLIHELSKSSLAQ